MAKETEDRGWIKLHRSIQNHWIWDSEKEPFDSRSALADLLLMANHSENKIRFKNELIIVDRGQRVTSLRKLSERWNWSNTKVRNFLKLLESDGMIIMEKDSKKTVITLCNYNKYQDSEPHEKNTVETQEIHTENTEETDREHAKDTSNTREHTNKNYKNYKNYKNDNNSVVVGVIGPAANFDDISQKYMEIFGSPLTPTFQQALQGYLDKGLTEELIVLAIEEAGIQNCKSFSYLRGILNNWYNAGVKSADQARQLMAEHEANKKRKSNKNKRKGGNASDNQKSSGFTEGEEDFYKKIFG